jgi:hypothetical protein
VTPVDLGPLPPSFASTRDGLRALACFVMSPARKARTGRIGLRATGDGFGTPASDPGPRLVLRGDRLARGPGEGIRISTLRATAAFVGVELTADPGVGEDLPPFRPDDDLAVDADASSALGRWYAFGDDVLTGVAAAVDHAGFAEVQLWPEHFDLATVADLAGGARANVGFSPGDGWRSEPYVYVGPHDLDRLGGDEWNAPFGAAMTYGELTSADDPRAATTAFVVDRLTRLS